MHSYLVTRTIERREKHARGRPSEAADAEISLLLNTVLDCEGMADEAVLKHGMTSMSYSNASG